MRPQFLGCVLILTLAGPLAAHAAEAVGGGRPVKRFASVDGHWGNLEVGETEGARKRLVVTGPSSAGPALGDPAARLAYYAPSVQGLDLGVSYAPLPEGAATLTDPQRAMHMIEAAASKKLRLGEMRGTVTVGASRATVHAGSGRVPKRSWIVGAQVGWRALRLGGELRNRRLSDGAEARGWATAIACGTGAWAVKMQISHLRTDAEPTTNDRVAMTASWRPSGPAPGRWRINAGVDHSSTDEADSTMVRLAAKLTF